MVVVVGEGDGGGSGGEVIVRRETSDLLPTPLDGHAAARDVQRLGIFLLRPHRRRPSKEKPSDWICARRAAYMSYVHMTHARLCVCVCVCVCGSRMPLTATLQNELEIVGVQCGHHGPCPC